MGILGSGKKEIKLEFISDVNGEKWSKELGEVSINLEKLKEQFFIGEEINEFFEPSKKEKFVPAPPNFKYDKRMKRRK